MVHVKEPRMLTFLQTAHHWDEAVEDNQLIRLRVYSYPQMIISCLSHSK